MIRTVAIIVGSLACACSGGAAAPAGDAADGAFPREGGLEAAPGPDVTTSAQDAGLEASPGSDASPLPGSCAPLADAGIAGYSTLVNGTFMGPVSNGVACHAQTHLYVSPYTTPPNQLMLFLNSSNSPGDITFQSPPGAAHGILTGLLPVSAPAAGTYGSSIGQPCGGVVFGYQLPVPPTVDCDGGVPPNCPPGCSAACPAFGCSGIPCTPAAPEVSYEVYGSTDCLGNSQTVKGSWTLTLTSVVPYTDPPGTTGTYYTPHGTLTLNMTGGDGGTDTDTLSLYF